MSDNGQNKQLILISGESGTGKSMSLMNIRNQDRWLYLNCEAGKNLPFRNNFDTHIITDPYQIEEAFQYANDNLDSVDGIIIDSLTFLIDMFESQYVLTAADTRAAWSDYAQYVKNIMQNLVPNYPKPVIFTAHTRTDVDEGTKTFKTAVPVKGALRGVGIESFFSTVVSTKVLNLNDLKDYENDMLDITEDDEIVNYKHVFQTRHTRKTTSERIRSPYGFFGVKETFINNDAQVLLDHLDKMYSGD